MVFVLGMSIGYSIGLVLILWRFQVFDAGNNLLQGGHPFPTYLQIADILEWLFPK